VYTGVVPMVVPPIDATVVTVPVTTAVPEVTTVPVITFTGTASVTVFTICTDISHFGKDYRARVNAPAAPNAIAYWGNMAPRAPVMVPACFLKNPAVPLMDFHRVARCVGFSKN
jgi:hypothetical protein